MADNEIENKGSKPQAMKDDYEILSMGIMMMVFHIERGKTQFHDCAKAMIQDLGDAIRPYLKALYYGAYGCLLENESQYCREMTPFSVLESLDTSCFDKVTETDLNCTETTKYTYELASPLPDEKSDNERTRMERWERKQKMLLKDLTEDEWIDVITHILPLTKSEAEEMLYYSRTHI